MTEPAAMMPDFSAPYAGEDEAIAAMLLTTGRLSVEQEGRVDVATRSLIEAIRAKGGRLGGVEDMLHEFALSSREGVAIMVLAEAGPGYGRSTDRGQAWSGRLCKSRSEVGYTAGERLGLGAWDHGTHHTAG
jgi:hypothetical protein